MYIMKTRKNTLRRKNKSRMRKRRGGAAASTNAALSIDELSNAALSDMRFTTLTEPRNINFITSLKILLKLGKPIWGAYGSIRADIVNKVATFLTEDFIAIYNKRDKNITPTELEKLLRVYQINFNSVFVSKNRAD